MSTPPSPPTPPTPPPSDPPAPAPEPPTTAAGPRRLFRSKKDRVLGGVAGGLAEYFGIDPIIVRLTAVALVFAGGAGLLLYVAAVLLVPEEGAPQDGDRTTWGRAATVAGIVVLVCALAALIPGNLGWGWSGDVLGPIAFFGLLGLAIWWLTSGQHPSGSGRDLARRLGIALFVLALCALLAVGAFWTAATGGGTVAALLILGAAAALLAAAFRRGGARLLILPALAVAIPAAFVSAAGIDAEGGVGDRTYAPTSAAQVRDGYRLGMGRIVVDLRRAGLPAGDKPLKLDLGVGDAVVVVPRDVCVATRGRIGIGAYVPFGRDEGGVDVDLDDQPAAHAGTPRLVVDADIGVGALEIRRTPPDDRRDHWRAPSGADPTGAGNAACVGAPA